MRMRFVRNPLFEAEVRAQPSYALLMRRAGDRVGRFADRFCQEIEAPWMQRGNEPTIVVVQQGNRVAVLNTDYGGHLMEWGSVNNPPHAPLRRAVRAAGLSLK
jgi:hypothetical protein